MAVSLLQACGAPEQAPCHFGAEATLEESLGGRFSGLSMAALGERSYAVLSSPEGTFLHRLDQPLTPVRLGAECDAGSALAASATRLFFACMRRGDADRDMPGRLMLLELDADAHVMLRKCLAYVRAQEKFDAQLAALVPQLESYFAKSPSAPKPQDQL